MSSPHARGGVLSVAVVTTTLLLSACTAGPGPSTGTTGAPAANISLAAPAPPASPPSSCTGTDANVALPSAPHGLFVADSNTPEVTSLVSRAVVAQDVATDPTVCGADIVVPWSSVDRGPNAAARYDWSFVDRAAAPWIAAGKSVNLVVWGTAGATAQQWGQPVTPAYVRAQVDLVRCGDGTPPTPVFWEPGYADNWRAFVAAVIAHFATTPWIASIRFGIGVAGGDAVSAAPSAACREQWRSYGMTAALWTSYSIATVDAEAALGSPKPLFVGVDDSFGTVALPRSVTARAAADRLGVEAHGLNGNAVVAFAKARTCPGDFCALFPALAGKVPLAVGAAPGAGGAASPALAYLALDNRAQVVELGVAAWLVADDANWPGYAAQHAAQAAALARAAAILGRA